MDKDRLENAAKKFNDISTAIIEANEEANKCYKVYLNAVLKFQSLRGERILVERELMAAACGVSEDRIVEHLMPISSNEMLETEDDEPDLG